MKPDGAITPPLAIDFSPYALMEALRLMGVVLPNITITVGPYESFHACKTIKGMNGNSSDNPAAPTMALRVNHEFKPYEWMVEAEGKVFWCQGP